MNQFFRYARALLGIVLRRPITGTTLIPIAPNGQVVLVRRRDTDLWSFPGGIIDWGESILQSARRELREETGLDLQAVDRLVGVYSHPQRDPRFHAISIAIAVQVAGDLRIGDIHEISEIQAFDLEKAAHLSLSHDHNQLLTDFLAGHTAIM